LTPKGEKKILKKHSLIMIVEEIIGDIELPRPIEGLS
jgi:hypothetical protein